MADLDPLIRVRTRGVEQKQKFLAELYRQAEELAASRQALEDQLARELEHMQEFEVSMLPYFGPYQEAVKERIKEIAQAQVTLDTRIEIAREDMREAFAELKKIEIVRDRRLEEAEKVLEKKESDTLDEIGITIFRRNQEEE